jgi:hypothetical protein
MSKIKKKNKKEKEKKQDRRPWLMPVILATQAEIRRVAV